MAGLQEIVGSRHEVRLDAQVLRSLVPDIAYRDVYICGPGGFTAQIADAAQPARDGRGADPHRDVRVLMPGRDRQQMRSSEGLAL